VGSETSTRDDAIVIDYSERAKTHALRILKTAEGKCVVAIQPANFGMTSGITIVD
jgi:hypothetical protein